MSETWREIFSQAAVGIAQIGLNGEWLMVNKRCCEALGYSESEMRGKTLRDVTHPEDWKEVQAGGERLLAGEIRTHAVDQRYCRENGAVYWARLHRSLVRDRNNRPEYFVAVIEDLAEKIATEGALRASEQRLSLAQDAAHLGLWHRNLLTGEVKTFGQFAELYGVQPDEVPQAFKNWLQMVHPDDRKYVGEAVADSIQRKKNWEIEFRIRRPDGSLRWLCGKGAVYCDAEGRATHTAGINFDITERKTAEAALRASEERFRRVFEEGPLGLALVGRDYRFLKVNSALCRMVDYAEDVLVQKSFTDITHPEDVNADVDLAERLFKLEIPFYRMQKRYVKRNGDVIWINLTASLIHDLEGHPQHGIAMVEDITEVKRTQQEALLRQKLESVGTLAGGIAHDFNNLLGGVLAQAELAQAELAAGGNPSGELEAIREVAIRGAEIIRQLMIYAGKEGDAAGVVDLSKTVEEMLALLRVSVTKHAVMKADLGRELPAARASASQIRQMVVNLITNASDAVGDREGTIRVITRRATKAEKSAAGLTDDYLTLEVRDTGQGVPAEIQAKVFDPFFTTKPGGHGLGLAVVQGMVRSLGGVIRLTSEPGKGATFQILLPCAERTAAPQAAGTAGRERRGASRHGSVLVVEDEGSLRQAVSTMLRKNGFEVFEAADGDEAIAVLRVSGRKIDLIMLDMTIPGASGEEIVSAAAKVRPDIRVVLTSAYSQEVIAGAMDAPQVCRFIRKPFQLGDLLKTLRETLG